jgi:hypothetical protein
MVAEPEAHFTPRKLRQQQSKVTCDSRQIALRLYAVSTLSSKTIDSPLSGCKASLSPLPHLRTGRRPHPGTRRQSTGSGRQPCWTGAGLSHDRGALAPEHALPYPGNAWAECHTNRTSLKAAVAGST